MIIDPQKIFSDKVYEAKHIETKFWLSKKEDFEFMQNEI